MEQLSSLEIIEAIDVNSLRSGEQRQNAGQEAVETKHKEDSSSIITIDEKCPKRLIQSRDPHGKNTFVKISFIDVFSEVDDLHTYEGVWYLSDKMYKSAKRKCYLFITIFLSIPISLICGIQLAIVTFLRVWCCLPCVKTLDIQLQCIHLLLHSIFRAFTVPFFESVGRCFYFLRARIYKSEGPK